MSPRLSLLPKSLTSRVFALYSATLLLFVGVGLTLFYSNQFASQIEDAQGAAVMLVEVVARSVQDSAVIGDYDTVNRTLEGLVAQTQFASAAFIDVHGGVIKQVSHDKPTVIPPEWLRGRVAERLYDVNRPISVGGRDYGILRLSFDSEGIAARIWAVSRIALVVALGGLLGGLILIRIPLTRWLSNIDRLRAFEGEIRAGRMDPKRLLAADVPLEIRQIFEVLNRTAASLLAEREHREGALQSLRDVLQRLLKGDRELASIAGTDRVDSSSDLQLLSRLVGELVRERETSRRELDNQKFALDQHAIVSITDRDGTILYANDRFCEISQYSRAELIGQNHRILKSGLHPPAFYEAMWATIGAGQVWHGEVCNTAKDGHRFWVSATVVPLLGPDGVPEQYIAIRTDISDRVAAEDALQKAKDAAEAANRAKSEFLANMSHEIRTPMNGILGMTELALYTELDDEQREYLEIVKSSADSLLTIINDILDLSKIEAGKLSIERIPFAPARLVADTLKTFALRAQEKGLQLESSLAADLPPELEGDPVRLRQVLINLVGNAIKFTQAGAVTVEVRVAEHAAHGVVLHACVRDTGVGIAPEKQQHIFGAFSQEDATITRRYGGTGLGLTICSRLVELMGGRIWLESALGSGSTFHFTVSLGPGLAVGLSDGNPVIPAKAGIQ